MECERQRKKWVTRARRVGERYYETEKKGRREQVGHANAGIFPEKRTEEQREGEKNGEVSAREKENP